MNSRFCTRKYLAPAALCVLTACSTSTLHEPLENASNRATPLSFGLYVTPNPNENPIEPPERFSGYHAAVDYEVSAGEVEGDVPVYAICPGKVIFSGYADGYGGLLVHRCKISGENVTVIYGHLALEGIAEEGTRVRAGQTIGALAADRSYGSGENRKHLHLGIHKGKKLVIRGYVPTEEDLKSYIDPATVLPSLSIDLPGESAGETPYWQNETEE